MWQYDILDHNKFRWISGSDTENPSSVQGTQLVFDPANVPSGITNFGIVEIQDSIFVFFGSMGGGTYYNIQWQYEPQLFCFEIQYNNESVCSGYGTCIEPDVCLCSRLLNITGTQCEEWYCYEILQSNETVCSGHGVCKYFVLLLIEIRYWTGYLLL